MMCRNWILTKMCSDASCHNKSVLKPRTISGRSFYDIKPVYYQASLNLFIICSSLFHINLAGICNKWSTGPKPSLYCRFPCARN